MQNQRCGVWLPASRLHKTSGGSGSNTAWHDGCGTMVRVGVADCDNGGAVDASRWFLVVRNCVLLVSLVELATLFFISFV